MTCYIVTLQSHYYTGTEFEAIFISALECINAAHEPLDATKSICDRYVFNTALTRSRSLVVVVGNPFLLLKVEETLIKKHNDPLYTTWRSYIRQCLECNSFSYSKDIAKSSINDTTRRLYELVYSDSVATPHLNCKPSDSILDSYQKVFESKKGCKNLKLLLSSDQDAQLTWKTTERSGGSRVRRKEKEVIHYSDHCLCKLEFLNYRKVKATPLSDKKKVIIIQGKKNLMNAFDGDTVEVGVFEDCPSNKLYGRVLKCKERGSSLQYICRVADYSPIVFFPIDKKNPKFINLPTLSRVLLQNEKIASESESNFRYNDVLVFDPKIDNGLPRVVQVIPHAVALKMLFLVSFVMWKQKYYNPLGIVIGVCSKGHTLLKAELLLKLEYSVTYNSDEDDLPGPGDVEPDLDIPRFDRAFTIDPADAKNLDDALSIIKQENENGHEVYQIGVHIANVAKHIAAGSEEDKAAKNCGTSFYGGRRMMHMLVDKNRRRLLSLSPGKLRDVISVTCNATMLPSGLWQFGDSNINSAQVCSAVKLSYSQAQDLLRGQVPPEHALQISQFDRDNQNPSLCESMRLLHKVAMALRLIRFENSDKAYTYENDDHDEETNLQAHLLVSELMIWANNEVAKKIHSDYPNTALLCRQHPPSTETPSSEQLEQIHINGMLGSLFFSSYLNTEGIALTNTDIILSYDTLKQALRENDPILLAHLLSSDRLYPQLAPVISRLRLLSKRSEYCCTDQEETDPTAYRHFSLCLDHYTHFSSPIRRYADIVVQRMLLQQLTLSHDELAELCIHLNNKKRSAASYERAINRIRLACDLLDSSAVCTAYVSQQGTSSMELAFPDPDLTLQSLPHSGKTLETNRCFPYAKDSEVYTWRLRVTSLTKEYATKLLPIPEYDVNRLSAVSHSNADSKADLLKAYCNYDDLTFDVHRFSAVPCESNVPISYNDWEGILRLIREPTEENARNVKRALRNLPSKRLATSPKLSTTYLFWDCDIKLSLKESDSVKVWLSWSTREPVISPAIQLLEVSPLLRICLEHNINPASCFSDPDLEMASLKKYSSSEQYIELWKKVILAEAAAKSVHECQPTVIRDVYLEWPELETPDDCIEVQYYLPTDSIKMTLPGKFLENCSEFFRIRIGDLICARYGCDYQQRDNKLRAVYHFVVHEVQEIEGDKLETGKEVIREGKKKKKKRGKRQQVIDQAVQQDVVVILKPVGTINCRVSSGIKKKLENQSEKFLCEVQIIPMTVSYR